MPDFRITSAPTHRTSVRDTHIIWEDQRIAANALSAAASVSAISRVPCAADTNPASNADGAK